MIDDIPVFLASDNNYAPFVATTIISVCENTKSHCMFHVLDSGISDENRQKIIQSCVSEINCDIEFVKIDADTLFKNFRIGGYFTPSIFSRFLIPELFSNIKKAIYLDVDTIACGDISELYNTDLKSFAIGAAKDCGNLSYISRIKERMNISNSSIYFNSGVLLIDLEKWRNNNIVNALFNLEVGYRGKYDGDQDILNKFFENNYYLLPDKFNIMLGNNKGTIKHYALKPKPWEVSPYICNGLADDYSLFWIYAYKTLFYESLISSVTFREKNKLDLRMRIKNFMCNLAVNDELSCSK